MSDHVELKPIIQTPPAPSNPEPPTPETIFTDTESSILANGSEHGGTYFELDWQIGQGQNRQQTLLTTFYGEPPSEPTDVDYSGETFVESSAAVDGDGNSFAPISFGHNNNQYDYGDHLLESNFYGDGENNALPNYYNANANDSLSLFSTEFSPADANDFTWNDFVDLVSDDESFSEFRDRAPDFWREVRAISERNIHQNSDGSQMESVPKYEQMLTEMRSENLSPEEFAETLSPTEREVFKARQQIDRTFGADIFESDGVTFNEIGQNRIRQITLENDQSVFVSSDAPPISDIERPTAIGDGTAITPGFEFAAASDDQTLTENSAIVFSPSEEIEFGESKSPDKSAHIAVGGNANLIWTETAVLRSVAGSAISENSSSVNAVVRRGDGGAAAMGGALVNGSYASIDNFNRAENKSIGGSHSIGGVQYDGGKSFAAGATGALLSAALGGLNFNANADIGGVVGFVSGIVTGAETDQGLRWLSGDRPTAISPVVDVNLLEDNSFASDLETVWA